MTDDLLRVEQLRVEFGRRRRRGVTGIDFTVAPGQRLGLIGESGSGKSVTGLAVMGLLPETARVSGSIRWRGTELLDLDDKEMSLLRGDQIAMVFQEPMTALDPTMKVGRQVAEALRLHHSRGGSARGTVVDMLDQVGLPEPRRIADSYPHQLSGGQRQRALMAMALVNSPDLLICDEPTTALDVTVQARVLETLDEVLDAVGAACLFISHDLAVVSQVCGDIMVMRDGELVERNSTDRLLRHPQHPYTRRLLRAAQLDLVEPGRQILLEDE
ncbi:MAG: ABC transporter ATP-binding protein [Acidipropionibacterium sp.]|jgi:peptide/nickel transport system ATP-binding protein|nr:ABC transporter ATP-binding protein [Acidipropionibacterium sp.]